MIAEFHCLIWVTSGEVTTAAQALKGGAARLSERRRRTRKRGIPWLHVGRIQCLPKTLANRNVATVLNPADRNAFHEGRFAMSIHAIAPR